ncbi:MAG: glycosyltransferase family 2 protein [Clostridiaceae bacterium]|nr:glycosyltransferase family 2 protein [Clostridiaceae bacterium]
MRASVIIPSYNAKERLKLNLCALNEQSYENNDVEVIVIDNGSTDDTMNLLDEFQLKYPMKTIRIEGNRGIAYGRNTGIYEAEGDILIFHDSDMIASKDFIKNHIEMHEELGIVACGVFWRRVFTFYYKAFSPYQLYRFESIMREKGMPETYKQDTQILNPSKVTAEQIMSWSFDLDFGFIEDFKEIIKKHGKTLSGYYLPWRFFITNNLSVERKKVMDVGMFDNNIVRYGYEDYDLGVRLYKSGCKFVIADHIISLHQEHPGNYKPEDLFININYMCEKYNNIYFIDVPLVCLSDNLSIDKTVLNGIVKDIYKLLPHKEYHDILQLFLDLLQVIRKRVFENDPKPNKSLIVRLGEMLGYYIKKVIFIKKKEGVPYFIDQLYNLFKTSFDIDFEKMVKFSEEKEVIS